MYIVFTETYNAINRVHSTYHGVQCVILQYFRPSTLPIQTNTLAEATVYTFTKMDIHGPALYIYFTHTESLRFLFLHRPGDALLAFPTTSSGYIVIRVDIGLAIGNGVRDWLSQR